MKRNEAKVELISLDKGDAFSIYNTRNAYTVHAIAFESVRGEPGAMSERYVIACKGKKLHVFYGSDLVIKR